MKTIEDAFHNDVIKRLDRLQDDLKWGYITLTEAYQQVVVLNADIKRWHS